MDHAKALAVQLPTDRLVTPFTAPIDPRLMELYDQTCYYGSVNADGTWASEPAAGWSVSKIGIGKYIVTHNLGYSNTILSVSVEHGSFTIDSHSPTEFTVTFPTDKNWIFTLARVISP